MFSRTLLRAATPSMGMVRITQPLMASATWYSSQHEWVTLDTTAKTAIIGVTKHAEQALGDVVYVDLPVVGDKFGAGDVFGNIESIKATSELFAPVSGEVAEVNAVVQSTPAIVNQDAEDKGWLIKLSNVGEAPVDLMNKEKYAAFCAEGAK